MLDWIEELDAEVADDAAADAYYHGLAREAAADRVYAVCAEIGYLSPDARPRAGSRRCPC
jgi:hypothetical protein